MTTMERSAPMTEQTISHQRRPLMIVVVAIVALLLGALGGWLIRGSDDGATDDAVEVVTGELTARQEEMLRVADDHYAAYLAGDGDALTALYVPQGILVVHEETGGADIVRADDGTMAAMWEGRAPSSRMTMMPPALVFDDAVLRIIDWGPGHGTVLHRFTPSGDVLIINTQFTQ